MDYWIVHDLTYERMATVRAFNGKKAVYTKTQARQFVDWLNDVQEDFGVHHVMLDGIREVADRLAVWL